MQKKKKGFTLVEFLVVIAILAILAAVSVVGYLSFTEKAKESNDISLITQMNTILQGESATDGVNKTTHDAVLDLKDNGLDVTKLTPTRKGYEFVYDLSQDKFFLLDQEKVIAPTNSSLSAYKTDIYKFIGKDGKLSNEYSNYLKDDYLAKETLTTTSGIDVGNNETITNIKYKNTGAKKKAIIRTNGGTLRIEAPLDTIYHYGESTIVRVNAIGENSYHEMGIVSSLNVKVGRIVVEDNSAVSEVFIEKDANIKGLKIEIKSSNNKVIIVDSTIKAGNVVEGNNVSLVTPTYVSNVSELDAALWTNEKEYVVLSNDIYTNENGATGDICTTSNITINGNGHKIYGHRKDKTTGNSRYATLTFYAKTEKDYKVILKNLTIENDSNEECVAIAVNWFTSDVTLDNINIITHGKNDTGILYTSDLYLKASNLNIINSSIKTSDTGYAIQTERQIHVNALNSRIDSWTFVFGQFRHSKQEINSSGSTYNIVKCIINTPNNQQQTGNNDFGAFTIYAHDTTINIKDTKINAESKGSAKQFIFLVNSSIGKGDKNLNFTIDGDSEVYGKLIGIHVVDISPKYQLNISGGIFNDEDVLGYVPITHKVIEDFPFYKVVLK